MRKNFIAILSAFIITASGVSAQQRETFSTYTVSKGETISKIARDYNITVTELFKYNPEAKSGIRPGQLLLIPQKYESSTKQSSSDSTAPSTKQKNYVVQPKETLYSISKAHNVSIENLLFWNPELKLTGLQTGSVIIIGQDQQNPQEGSAKYPTSLTASSVDTIVDINNIYYKYIKVEPQSTLYGLAVLYQTSIQRLVELNPELQQGLKTGQQIKVPSFGATTISKEDKKVDQNKQTPDFVSIRVEPKQTLYSLARNYNVSVGDLLLWNPEIQKQGLQSNMIIKIKVDNPQDFEQVVVEQDFTQTIDTPLKLENSLDLNTSKKVALLLPFNVNGVGEDVEAKLKSDNFLNMTLDFYSGAKLAVSKARSMGLDVQVDVFDSNEGKNSSGVIEIFSSNNFRDTDAIIGPFFQSNVENAAKNLPNSKVVLVSPLSNEKAVGSARVIQTMPYSDVLKSTLLNYFLKQKDTKVTVIVDDRRVSTKKFMRENYPSVRTISTTDLANVDKSLSLGVKNIFILDSASIESASVLTKTLSKLVDSYDIQLASFDKSDIFEYSEITVQSLVDLKYIYASVTKDTDNSMDEADFYQAYKDQFKIAPNRFAVRGYDVTLDVILRLFQKQGFSQTLQLSSQELENKFDYVPTSNGGLTNKGVYLLQYNDDFTVKVVQ
ncbi:LysM peptidoglycan-binding domain-containing protein [Myroides sp. LJL115]